MADYKNSLDILVMKARKKRKALGLTQQQASKALGLNYRHYQDIERSKVNLRLDTVCKLLTFYELGFSELESPTEIKDENISL